MRLSDSLRRNIMEASVGGIVNRFKIRKRRVTLFFGDIFMRYIEECESSGHKKEMKSIAEEWMLHYFNVLVPGSLKSLPLFLLNALMRKVWINLGLMDDFRIVRKGDVIEIHTRNEAISKNMGSNMFSVGLFSGVLKGMFGVGVEEVSIMQSKTSNKYVFRVIENSQPATVSKKNESYNSLNRYRSKAGTDLKRLMMKNIFSLGRDNKIFFRGNAIYPVENTLFHLIGASAIKQERIPEISYDFFRNAIDDVMPEKKLSMLKVMLEAMGWGNITIIVQGSRIVLEINNPPYGLQSGSDNWSFLISTILGYIWLINNEFRLTGVTTRNKRLRAEFACSHPAPVVAV